jgi:spore maturation protein CgeB
MKVVFWGSTHPEYEKYCPHWLGVRSGLKELGCNYLFLCCRSDPNYLSKTFRFNPDLIICGLTDPIAQYLPLENIRHKLPKVKIVFWYGDLRDEKNNRLQVDCKGLLDAMFVSNNGQEEFWKKNLHIDRVHFLPLACDPIEKPIYDDKFKFDKVFIGTKNYGGDFYKRAAMINEFEKNGVKRIDSQEVQLRTKIYQNMPKIYSSSKISLDISHYTDIPGYTSVRYWEIPAMWGFALTKRFPGCTDFYPESIHTYFDTMQEALEKMDYYLEHEEERKEMVEKAHKHSYNHTHAKRLKKMFEVLELI